MQSLAIFKSGSLFELDEGRLPSFSNHHFRKIELPVSGRMWPAESNPFLPFATDRFAEINFAKLSSAACQNCACMLPSFHSNLVQ
jgi:hypothetical protein